jgi:hypothetical protein
MIPTAGSVRKRIVTIYRKLEGTVRAMIPTARGVRKRIVTIYRKLEGTATVIIPTDPIHDMQNISPSPR